ncbi:MAG: four helix bundle protein, partial [Flavobacteriaceae bacterium]
MLCKNLPRSREFDAWVRQLIRSSSSVGANYRAACRAKSERDFINR